MQQAKAIRSETEADEFFENLVTVPGLLELLRKWLKRDSVSRNTVYKWVGQGMPHRKIRGELFFPPGEVATWLNRSE